MPCYTCKTIPNTTHTQNAGRECLPPSLLRHLSFPYKARLRNIAHSSWSWHQKALVMAPYNGRKPSKILTTHRVRSRAKITAFFGVLQSTTIKTRILFRTMQGASPPFLRQNTSKTRQNKRKKRDFPPKTPGFFAINIRTFGAKHRNIPSKKSDVFTFPAGKSRKNAEKRHQMPTKLILQYFGPKEVAVTSDGLLGPLSHPSITGSRPKKAESGKIAHSCIFRSPQHISAGFYGRSRRFLRHHLAPVVRVVPEAKPANSGA